MSMKRRTIVLLATCLSLLLLAIGCGSAGTPQGGGSSGGQSGQSQGGSSGGQGAAAEFTLKLGHDTMDDAMDLVSRHFLDQVAELSGGRIKTEVYPASQLGDNETMNRMVRTGALEAMIQPTAFLTPIIPGLGIFDLPFLFPDAEVENKVLNSAATDELAAQLTAEGHLPVAWASLGFKVYNSTFPIEKAEDFQGKVYRTMTSDILIRQYEAWGATVTPMSLSEVYTGLQQGTIGGHENPPDTVYHMKLFEVAPYVTQADHGSIPTVLTVSKVWFDKLPEDLQQVVLEAGTNTAEASVGITGPYAKQSLELLADEGATVYILPDAERAKLRELTEGVREHARNDAVLGPFVAGVEAEVKALTGN